MVLIAPFCCCKQGNDKSTILIFSWTYGIILVCSTT
jgi:hypothetical protein